MSLEPMEKDYVSAFFIYFYKLTSSLAEQEIIKNMSQSFEAVTQLETDLMSERKDLNMY